MRAAIRLLSLAPLLVLAACGPDSGFNNLGCRNKMYENPEVKAAIAASAAPDTDPAVLRAKQAAYDDCTSKLFPDRDPADSGPIRLPNR